MNNLWLHDHRRGQPWISAEHTVVDSYRLIGKQVRAFGYDVMTEGRLVAMEDDRTATLLGFDGQPYEQQVTRLELAEDLA